uniref:uncharacterized protein LOC120346953 n=1 Tax=Styela clava TaxID=7725 RepID=UPI00193A203F|nr:uncharacterized protein LOC120346953 [Styela clava]
MAESNDNINVPDADDEIVNKDNNMSENMSVTGSSEATENNVIALQTIPTQDIIPVLPNESQSTSKDCHSASIKDLFLRSPDVESDVQPSSEKNNQGASGQLAKEGSTNAHAMTTRSKIKTNKSRTSKRNSQQHRSVIRSLTSRSGTFRSQSSFSSRMSDLSNSQIENIFETKKLNQQRRTELEKQQLKNRLENEKQIWEDNNQVENLKLNKEWQAILQKQQAEEERLRKLKAEEDERLRKLKAEEEERLRKLKAEEEERLRKLKAEEQEQQRKLKAEEEEQQRKRKAEFEAFQHRRQQIMQTRNIEFAKFNKRKQMNLQEIEDKNQREQLELDTNLNETLAERGVVINTPPVAASVEIHQQLSNSATQQTEILNVTSPLLPALSTPFSTPSQFPVSRSFDMQCEEQSSERVNTSEHGESVSYSSSGFGFCRPQRVPSACVTVVESVCDMAQIPLTSENMFVSSCSVVNSGLTSCVPASCVSEPSLRGCEIPMSCVGDNRQLQSNAIYTGAGTNHSEIITKFPTSFNTIPLHTTSLAVNMNPTLPTLVDNPGRIENAEAMHSVNIGSIQNPIVGSQPSNTNAQNNNISQAANPQVIYVPQTLGLPPSEPPVFCGNAGEYRDFIDIFETVIGSRLQNPKHKLVYLLQYTKGPARALVKGCQHRTDSYDEAIRLLEETYGQKFQIGESCINSIANGPRLNLSNKESLTVYSAEIMSCKNTLIGVEYKNVALMTIEKIALRMPPEWRSGWLSKMDNVLQIKKKDLTIEDLADYVRKKTREVCNVPSIEFNTSKQIISTRGSRPYKSSFATTVHNNRPVRRCVKCDGDHYLNQCDEFRGMTYDKRLEFVKKQKLCFSCLLSGHWVRECKRNNPCKNANCRRKHTTLLHPPDKEPIKVPTSSSHESTTQTHNDYRTQMSETKFNAFLNASDEQKVLLNVVPVKVRIAGRRNAVITNAFFDNGSTCSFISNSLMNKLKVNGPVTNLNIRTINNTVEHKQCTVIKNLELADFEESKYVRLNPLFSNDQIGVDQTDIPTQSDLDQFKEFNGIVLPKVECDVELLIGKDNLGLHKPLEVIYGPNNYFASKTIAGWMVNCPAKNGNTKNSTYFTKSQLNPLCQMCADVVHSAINEKDEVSPIQQVFLDKVSKSIKLRTDGHYEIGLPLKNPDVKLHSNKYQVLQRAKSLKRRLHKEPEFYAEYKDFVANMITMGYAEEVLNTNEEEGRTWYLSHHGVRHPEKKTLRVVFDCSAKSEGISFNDILLQGPDLTNNLVGVLSRFRKNIVAVQGDIRSMFHQVKVKECDRNFLRFFWWENGDITLPMKIYRMSVFLFGTVCSPSCCNFALRQTAIDNKNDFEQSVIDAINDSFYVDDFCDSKPDAASALQHIKSVTEIAAKGGFEVTKWVSNDREVLASIPEAHRSKEATRLDISIDELPVERALGMIWNANEDTLSFSTKYTERPATRRGMLGVVNSIFDPLGIGQPVIQPMKVLMQGLCRKKLEWDDSIPTECEQEWLKWISELSKLKDFTIPRCFLPANFGETTEIQIHHFSDASEKSYGAVSYIRLKNFSGQIHCSILCGKSRLIPLKGSTIPRLELCAATISARNEKFFRKELKLPIDASIFWTDSTTVLRYLANTDKVLKTFVANRVNVIKEVSDVNQWYYVPSKLNPADVASRGMSADEFLNYPQWKFGPEFLWKNQEEWPKQPDFLHSMNDKDLEFKKQSPHSQMCFALNTYIPTVLDQVTTKYSNWFKMKKIVAWVLRYKRALLSKVREDVSCNLGSGNNKFLSVDEVNLAELEIIKNEQFKYYSKEINVLAKGEQLPKSSPLCKLQPIMKEGLLRVGGRIGASSLQYDAKHPIIIPNKSSIANLIIEHTHQVTGHSGREYVIAELHQKFWIIKANAMTRKILNNCISCRKRQRAPESQLMADLPEDRLIPDKPPFSFVALDCFGPFLVRQGRSEVKRYGVIFTCLVTRAVHVEIAHSLDTSAFIMSLRRFISRRGQVVEIRSDNGTNFVSGEQELRNSIKTWNQNQIHRFLLQKNIKWLFQTPAASHHGGVFERQIRTIRKIFNAIAENKIN